ncbi:MAG: hypothetical protein LBG88_03775 [Christensenellaceae bacterium]|nr:hypothetical protein [Christensenellaceae bacterium]
MEQNQNQIWKDAENCIVAIESLNTRAGVAPRIGKVSLEKWGGHALTGVVNGKFTHHTNRFELRDRKGDFVELDYIYRKERDIGGDRDVFRAITMVNEEDMIFSYGVEQGDGVVKDKSFHYNAKTDELMDLNSDEENRKPTEEEKRYMSRQLRSATKDINEIEASIEQ